MGTETEKMMSHGHAAFCTFMLPDLKVKDVNYFLFPPSFLHVLLLFLTLHPNRLVLVYNSAVL